MTATQHSDRSSSTNSTRRTLARVLLAAHLIAAAGYAANYFVATDGDDSNDGSAAAPFRTIARGVDAAGPGDAVIVRDGTYYAEGALTCGDGCDVNHSPVVITKSGTPSAYITIQAEHKWGAVLDCQLLCDSYFNLDAGAAYLVIQDFVITRAYWDAIHSNEDAHDIRIRGNRIEFIGNRPTSTPLGLSGIYASPACYNFVIDGNVFHDIGRANAGSSLDHALYLHGSNYTIVSNVFYNLRNGWAIQAADGLSNVLIANNTFAFPNPAADGQIMLWNRQSRLTIRNNIFYRPGGNAIVRFDSYVVDCSLDHNLVYGAAGLIEDAGGCGVVNNILQADPMFVRADLPPYDFHLQRISPAIAAGFPLPVVTIDLDGNIRPAGVAPDVGAYQ